MKKNVCAWLLIVLLTVLPVLSLAEDDASDPVPVSAPETESAEPDPSSMPAEPTAEPTSEPTAQPTQEPVIGETLSIDTATVYEGMQTSYGQGYLPTVAEGKATILLPLLGNTLGQRIRVTPELTAGGPYVLGNYQFDLNKSTVTAVDGSVHDVFLIRLNLPLAADRANGTYPIPFTIDYLMQDGTQAQQTFTVQLTITDGKNPNASSGGGSYRESVRKPVLMVDGVATLPAVLSGGDTANVTIAIKNVGNYDAKNIRVSLAPETDALSLLQDLSEQFVPKMTVNQKMEMTFALAVVPGAREGLTPVTVQISYEDRYGGMYSEETHIHLAVTQPKAEVIECAYEPMVAGGADLLVTLKLKNTGTRDASDIKVRYLGQDAAIRLKGADDVRPIGKLSIGETGEAVFELRALPSASEGKHALAFECTYTDAASGGSYTDSYESVVTVTQTASLGFDDIRLPESVTSGESFSQPICVYNTGFTPIYNVRCALNCDGLICASAYLGNLDPQTSAEKTITVFATTLSNSEKYGTSYGSFEITYEDADGNPHYEGGSLRIQINEPEVKTDAEKERERQKVEEQQTLSKWWVSVLIGIAVICILIAAIVIAKFMRMLKMK